jgi:hypothetical protein
MEPCVKNWVSDVPIEPVEGYQNINSQKSYRLLRAKNVKIGTFIVRPSSDPQTCTMDVKADTIESYQFHKDNSVYSFTKRGQDVISANSITDLIKKILLQHKWEAYVSPFTLPDLGG